MTGPNVSLSISTEVQDYILKHQKRMKEVKYSLWDLICCLESLLLVAVKNNNKKLSAQCYK